MADTSRLPRPCTQPWDWQLHAACRGMNSALFFHGDAERGRARQEREERAKRICRSCPVLRPCREHALAVREPYGIWGGLGEQERRDLLARRERGVPAA